MCCAFEELQKSSLMNKQNSHLLILVVYLHTHRVDGVMSCIPEGAVLFCLVIG